MVRIPSRIEASSAIAFVAREVSATARVALAAGSGWRGRAHVGELRRDDVVVLVHGLSATAGAFAPLVKHLRSKLDVDVHTFTYVPGANLDAIATRIDRCLDHHRGAARVHLVGHSLGGLAARWYVQEHRHDPRIVQTISVASPFLGLDVADLFPDVLRGLVVPLHGQLARIVAGASRSLSRVPHLSVVADRDALVRPATTGILPGAPSYVLHDTGHNGALFHPRLHALVAREVEKRMVMAEMKSAAE